MKILVSNDDGFDAKGIKILVQCLSEVHQVVVVAPSENKSAASSSLTLNRPLKPIKAAENVYHIDATPSDCVHLALCGFLQEDIDLVITGINFGANMGDDVIYSGTVAGAIEGRFLDFPSMAISLAGWQGKHFETAGLIAKQLVDKIAHAQFSRDMVLNINVPDVPINEIAGFQTTRLGKRHKSEQATQDENDASLYWVGENGAEAQNGIGTDFYAVANNFVSITPLQIDLTKYDEIDRLSKWLEGV